MEVFDAIKSRRSIKKFLRKEVEHEKIVKILEAGRWAPNAGNFQECRFVIVKDEQKRVKLSEACYGQYWMVEAPVHLVIVSKTEHLKKLFGSRGLEVYIYQNAGALIQNMLLSIKDLGLGSCWVGAFDEDMVKRELKIPDEMKVMAVLPIGYPAENPSPPPRIDLEDLVYFENYGKRLVE